MIRTLPAPRTPDPADAPPLRWGILAPGGIANTFVEALHRFTRQRAVAVGSRSLDRAQAFADRHGIERAHTSYEQLVADDIDAVYIASPHSHHREHALLAIAAGKHVLVEKAFTRTASEARDVVDAARAAGVTAVEAMWTRFLPTTDIVRQLLADGALGTLESFAADHGQWFAFDPQSRLFAPELAGGALLDLGVYPVSYASFVLGTPTRITARGTLAPTGVDRQVSAVFEYGSDAHAVVSTTLAAKTPTTATISGSEARIELAGDFYTPGIVRLVTRDSEVAESEPPRIPGHLGLCHEAAHLAQIVADGVRESPLLPLDETVAIMATMDAMRAQLPQPV